MEYKFLPLFMLVGILATCVQSRSIHDHKFAIQHEQEMELYTIYDEDGGETRVTHMHHVFQPCADTDYIKVHDLRNLIIGSHHHDQDRLIELLANKEFDICASPDGYKEVLYMNKDLDQLVLSKFDRPGFYSLRAKIINPSDGEILIYMGSGSDTKYIGQRRDTIIQTDNEERAKNDRRNRFVFKMHVQ